jgi:hypothetical protein
MFPFASNAMKPVAVLICASAVVDVHGLAVVHEPGTAG